MLKKNKNKKIIHHIVKINEVMNYFGYYNINKLEFNMLYAKMKNM